jgi:DedD protein
MAKEQQDVDTLKRRGRRRLVGAVALVLLAIILLPMVFDQEPRSPVPPVSVRIPGEDEAPFKPAPPAAPQQTGKPEQKKQPVGKAPEQQYVVPVGAFANPDPVVDQLKAAGIPHYTERVQGLTRVRAGPFASRQAADKALHELKGLGLEPGAVTTKAG